jgi:hypothetical protein
LEGNRVLREQMGKKRLSFSDAQERRLAAKAKRHEQANDTNLRTLEVSSFSAGPARRL